MPLLTLILAVSSLAVGPVIVSTIGAKKSFRVAVDAAMKVVVVGLCVFVLLPHAVEHGGLVTLAAAGVGILLPVILHRIDLARGWLWPAVAMGALAVHAGMDGAVLGVMEEGVDLSMALAIVAHRVPVGFAVFEGTAARAPVVRRSLWGWLAIGGLMGATAAGFVASRLGAAALSESGLGALEGFVIGAVLHVVLVTHSESQDAS